MVENFSIYLAGRRFAQALVDKRQRASEDHRCQRRNRRVKELGLNCKWTAIGSVRRIRATNFNLARAVENLWLNGGCLTTY
jgi:hypothetical protein